MGKSKSAYLECVSEKAKRDFLRGMLSDNYLNRLIKSQEEEER